MTAQAYQPYLSKQQIFSAVYTQSLKKTRCIQNGSCLYSDQKGKKCFIGALIPDELYKTSLEDRKGNDVLIELGMLPDRNSLTPHVLDVDDDYYDMRGFISQLQKVHDSLDISVWNDSLLDIAKRHNLTVPNAQI